MNDPVTEWYVNIKDTWSFNHIENGHSTDDVPVPKFKAQHSWLNNKWKKEFVYITADHILTDDRRR